MKHFQCVLAAASAIALLANTAHAQGGDDYVTFEQVLQNPGDIDLNLQYAQQHIASGNLIQAASTLERMLFFEPNWDEARLMYAGVLYRLGDFEAAQREMELLDGREISEEARRHIDAYNDRVNSAVQPSRFSGRFSLGVGYDENAGTLLTEDDSGIIANQQDQFSLVGRGNLSYEHDLSDAQNLAFFARGDFVTKQFEDDTFGGYTILRGRTGLRGANALVDWRANLSVRNIRIQGNSFVTEVGGEAQVSRDLGKNANVGVRIGYHDQDYDETFNEGQAIADARDGQRFDAALIGRYDFNSRVRAHGAIEYRDKTAVIGDFAYSFVGVGVGADVFFSNGAYLDTDAFYRDYDYDSARADEYVFARAAVGVPVVNLVPNWEAPIADNLVLEGAVFVTDRSSTIDTFDFDSVGAEIRVIWRFGQ